MLRDVYASHGAARMVSVVNNFSGRKEYVCRKLGVVCESDVSRVASVLKQRQTKIGQPST